MKFNPDHDIPSLTGRVVLVTGGTDGLGKETIRQLLKHSPLHIYATARSTTKADAVRKEFDESIPDHAPLTFVTMDLASFASVKAGAQQFLGLATRLDILICNAGITGPRGQTTEGYEMHWGVNHMAHALLIQLLLPLLLKTAQEPNTDVRVVIVSSQAEELAPKTYSFDRMKTPLADFWFMKRYGQSKLANCHYASMLPRKHPEATSGVKFVSVHPGAVLTNISNEMFGTWNNSIGAVARKLVGLFTSMVKVEVGAWNQLWAATASRELLENGEFYLPVGVGGKGTDMFKDVNMAEGLWEYTAKELAEYL